MGKKIYIEDTGTELILDTNEDITGATVSITVRKGDGTTDEFEIPHGSELRPTTCSVFETTKVKYVLGIHEYNTDNDPAKPADPTRTVYDLSCGGIYKVQAKVVLSSGWAGLGETCEFRVWNHFE